MVVPVRRNGISEQATVTELACRRILFVSSDAHRPIPALSRAYALAVRLDAELFVLQIDEPESGWRKLLRHERAASAQRDLALDACEKTFQHDARILFEANRTRILLGRRGDLMRESARAAKEFAADLVVLSPRARGNGLLAMDLAMAAKTPVLIARPARRHNIVLAATNLADCRYPVIRRARQFVAPLQARLVLVHNVEPQPLPPGWTSGDSSHLHSSPRLAAQRSAHLQQIVGGAAGITSTLVKTAQNTAQAILETGQEYDADLIVVGALKETSKLARMFGGNVAARVAEQASSSVLLTPNAQIAHS